MGDVQPYAIVKPPIRTGMVYYFTTGSGLEYEVRFGRKENDYLNVTIVFGVVNSEFGGEEYMVTNRGEIFRVMATLMEILRIFDNEHPFIKVYEFFGEAKQEEKGKVSQRSLLYYRYVRKILNDNWTIEQDGNRIIVKKINLEGKNLFEPKNNGHE